MPESPRGLRSALFYKDPKAAIAFLEKAFGFELVMLIEDGEGKLVHSQLRYGDSAVMVGTEWSDDHKSPSSVGGKVTQAIHIHIDEDLDAHCARARAAGADVFAPPETQFYGD